MTLCQFPTYPGLSPTFPRTQWSRYCLCGFSPPRAAPGASSNVSAPAVGALKRAELFCRSPPTSATPRGETTQKPLEGALQIAAQLIVLSMTFQSLQQTAATHFTTSVPHTQTETLM